VLFTASPSQLLDVCDGIDGPYRERLRRIKYKANICALVSLKKPLSNYYWTTVADRRLPFVAVIEHTRIIPPDAYGTHIVYLTRYLDESDPLFSAPDVDIRSAFLKGLGEMHGLNEDDVTGFFVHRSRFSQPVITQRYSEVKPDYQTPVDGLFLACMAQIYPEDRGMNYAIREGRNVASLMNQR